MMQDLDASSTKSSGRCRIILAALIVPNIFLWTGLFIADGTIIQRDFNFPIFNETFESAYFPLWNEYTSQTNIERFPRLIMMTPFLGLSMLGVEVSLILKVMIIGAFTFMVATSYFFLSALQKHISMNSGRPTLSSRLIPIVGAYLFAYTPISLQFSWEISFLVSIGALPLMMYIVLTQLTKRYFPILIAVPLLLCLAHPFLFIINAITVVSFAFVIYRKSVKMRTISMKLLTGGVLGMSLLAWLWIPYVGFPTNSTELGRDAHLERDVFDDVSDNNAYNILLLERDRFTYVDTKSSDFLIKSVHYTSLAVLVTGAFISLMLARESFSRRVVLFFAGGFSVTTLFALGSSGAIGELYWVFISESSIGWIVRSPLKFQLYQGFFLSMLFSVTLILIRPRIRLEQIPPILAILLVTSAGFYGIYDANYRSLNPIQIPTEYSEINDLLEQKNGNSKVVYFPRYNEVATYWSHGHMIAPFDMKSSKIPTYETYLGYNYVKEALYDYPYTNGELNSPNFYQYLTSLGIQYVVFHDDRGYDIDQRNLDYLQQSGSLMNLYSKNDWYLFEIEDDASAPIRAVSALSLVNGTPEVLRLSTPNVPAIDIRSFNASYFDDKKIETLYPSEIDTDIPLRNEIVNPKFETWAGTALDSWKMPSEYYEVSIVPELGSQENTLQISTPFAAENRWSGMISDEMNVEQGEKYLFTASVKTQNAYASHIKIQGYNATGGTWKDLTFVTHGNETTTGLSINSNTDWRRYWNSIIMPEDITKIRYVINAGNIAGVLRGDAYTLLREVGVYNLDHTIANRAHITYDKVSPTEYKVHVSSDTPILLILSESYDDGWIASDGVQELESIPVYGILNGFYIEKTGDFSLTLEYKPQKLFALGATISIAALIGMLFYALKLAGDMLLSDTRNPQVTIGKQSKHTQKLVVVSKEDGVKSVTSRERLMDQEVGIRNDPVTHFSKHDLKRNSSQVTEIMKIPVRKKLVLYIPVILAIAVTSCIPVMLLIGEMDHVNDVAGLALDFMIVGVLWTALCKKILLK